MLDPLTPADLDLRDFPYMPLDVVRLRDSDMAVVSTGEQFRAAVLLWCAAWHQVPAASLPDDERLLANLAGFGRDVKGWRAIAEPALHGFVSCSDGRLYHPVIAEKAIEAWAAKEKQRARTQAAAEARRTGKPTDPGAPPRNRHKKRDEAKNVDRYEHRHDASDIDRHDNRNDNRNDERDDARNEIQGKGREGKERNPKSTALEGCARDSKSDDPAIAIRREICGLVEPEMPPADMARVAMWLAQGYSTDLIRAVVVERIRDGKRPKSLAWFDGALHDAAQVKAPPAAPEKPAEPEVDLGAGLTWPLSAVQRVVSQWRENERSWPIGILGPRPGQPGCRVPPRFYTQEVA